MMLHTILIYVAAYFVLFTAVLFFIVLFQNTGPRKNPKLKRYSKVSIIVPVWNEEERLIGTMDSVVAIDWPDDKLEVIVIDDGSTDNTMEFIDKYRKYHFVKVFKKKNEGKAKAMNFGIKKATGEFIMNLDADSSIDPWCFKEMLGYFDVNQKVMAVIPYMLIKKPTKLIHRIQYIEFLSATFMRRIFTLLGGVFLAPGPGTVFRKSFFEKHGPIDENTIVEDIEVSMRIQKYHYMIEHAYGVCSYTMGAHKLSHLISQRLRWFRGFLDMLIKYRELFTPKYGNLGIFILPISVFSIVITLALFFYGLGKFVFNSIEGVLNLSLINFDISRWFEFNFNLFFVDTSPVTILVVLMLLMSALIIYLAKREAGVKRRIAFSYIIFTLTYWFLYAICWLKAIYYKLRDKKIRWGGQTG